MTQQTGKIPNEFILLRARAREKRDRIITAARQDYQQTLVTIMALEQDLLGRESSRHKAISTCVERVMPKDRTFTTADIMAGLEALDAGRVWRKRSVDSHISRLREKGLVKRLKKARNNELALYVRNGVQVAAMPFEDMTLAQVIEAVLTHPMNATELAVAMMESGYETAMSPNALRTAIGVELRKGRFSQMGGRWQKQA